MNWFLIAISAPALWALSNHVDKYLIEKYFKGEGVGALIIFSSVIGLFFLPFIALFKPAVFSLPVSQTVFIICSGIFAILATLVYLYALKKEDASTVVPLFQTIPVFAFILGYTILGETLTAGQTIGSVLIIGGGLFLSLDLNKKKTTIKSHALLLMLGSSLLYALSGLIFKIGAIQTDFWTTVFWGYTGDILIGIFFVVCVKSYRQEFVRTLQQNKGHIISLNAVNEIINLAALLIFRYATLLTPLALVWVVNGFQPFFVLLFGILLTKFLPTLSKENMDHVHIAQKVISISVLAIGTYLLNAL